jgi:hypothetical protein
MRVGIDVRSVGSGSVTLYVDTYVQCEPGWNFADNQHIALRGDSIGDWDFYNNLGSGQTRLIGTIANPNLNQSYGGGPTYNWTATLSGNYLGAGASVGRSYTLPALPASVPLPPSPGPVWSSITATTATLDWGISPNDNGSAVIEYNLQVSRNSGFTDLVVNSNSAGSIQAVSGLAPGTQYWSRARVRNSVGWSGYSAVTTGTTSAFATSAPTVSDIAPDAATVSWTAPSGGVATGYEVQWARDAAFTVASQTVTSTSWGTSRRITGLVPGVQYFTRVRSKTATGYGSWSGSTAFTTSAFSTSAPTISELGPDAATVNWSAPGGSTPTGYELQVAKDAAFTVALQKYTSSTWGTLRRVTGLSPATRYYVRVRSSTSTGYGSWSSTVPFDTLSGAKIRKGGVWVDAPVYVRVGGVWKAAKVYKRVNGQWVL